MALKAVPAQEVVPEAQALAASLAAAGPVAMRGATRTLRLQLGRGLDEALWREADAQAQCYASGDMVEGIAAVVEKRAPAFTQTEGYAPALPEGR